MGNFLGVFSKDKQGREIILSPGAYNKPFTEQKPWESQGEPDAKSEEPKLPLRIPE